MSAPTMRAIQVHAFGGPEVLTYERVPLPEPAPGEVLIRVHAAGLNPPDWYARTGFATLPSTIRPELRLPFTPGSDVSGVVAKVGSGVTQWRVGDPVFGLVRFPQLNNGGKGYAEYTTSPSAHLARKPANLSHIQAAAVPMSALTAYQFLFDHIKPLPGTTVVINGAAGGVGHFLVQLAKLRQARVIAIASGRHEAFLHKIGADEFIDYTTTDVQHVLRDVDHLIDTVGGPQGHRFVPLVRTGGTISPVFFGEYHREEAAHRRITLPAGQVHSDGHQMNQLAHLIEGGRICVGVDSTYSLPDAAKAHERAELGHIQGKIVLSVVEE
ncbi:NADP-dependent oxidoreductase [Micromonospora sp. NPDC049275]|uniref:NADP-dependent oxidoreductase n=1 Tax=Micromonospora sp. NPDC049275 TaxID=3364268 RepID=UPI00371931D3